MLTTRTELFPELEQLRKRLNLTGEAIFLPSVPRRDSVPDHCTDDVTRQVAELGGTAVYGWMIWIWPRMMAEATFHAVWRAPDGTLTDISAKHDGEKQILFIPDPSRTYDGNRVETVRIALWNHNLMHDFIRTSDEFVAEFTAQYGTEFVGEVEMRGRLLELYDRKARLLHKLQSFPRGKSQ